MATSTKNPPESKIEKNDPPKTSERFNTINAQVNQRLHTFKENNPKWVAYYADMVKTSPDRAVDSLLLNRMFRFEADTRQAKTLTPGAEEWLNKQSPDVQQRVHERVEQARPEERATVFIDLVSQEKAKIDFSPRTATGHGQSMGV